MKLYIILILFIFCCTSCKNSIEKVISNYNSNIYKSGYFQESYFNEKAMVAGKYVMYTDAVGYIISSGYDCSIPVDNFSFLANNIRKSNRKVKWLDFLDNVYSERYGITFQSDISPGVNSLFSSFRWFEEHGPFNSDKYRFTDQPALLNDSLSTIHFSQKDSLFDSRYSGDIIFEKNTHLVHKIILDSCHVFSEPFRKWTTASLQINYHYIKGKFFISSLELHYKKGELNHWITLFTINNLEEITEIKVKDLEYRLLCANDHNPFVRFDPGIWRNFQKFSEIDIVRKDLEETDVKLETQFKFNSDKQFIFTKGNFEPEDTLTGNELDIIRSTFNLKNNLKK